MPSIVYDEEILRSVVGHDEFTDMVFKLVLRLLANVELYNLGIVLEAIAE